MKKPSANSSDLAAASAIIHALDSRKRNQTPPHASTSYVKFSFPVQGPVPVSFPASPALAEPPVSPERLPVLDSWEVFLAWALELTRAHAGFVVDSQGFVIASRGNVPKDGFVGIGAELCYAMDQLDRINPEGGTLRLLELQFDSNRIIGVRASAGAMGIVHIGFQGTRSFPEETREALLRQLTLSLPRLA